MTPINELLNHIRWDAEFGRASFVLGYVDQDSDSVRYLALSDVRPDARNPSLLDVVDDRGARITIPFNRVRELLRDGEVIWRERRRHTVRGV